MRLNNLPPVNPGKQTSNQTDHRVPMGPPRAKGEPNTSLGTTAILPTTASFATLDRGPVVEAAVGNNQTSQLSSAAAVSGNPTPPPSPNTSQLSIPRYRPYVISSFHRRLLQTVDAFVDQGRNVNILVKGVQGCGKTEMVQQYAATRKRPLANVPVGRLSEVNQIFGQMDLKDGQTVYTPGLFLEAIQTPGCVIHLEEINRPETDKTLNGLFTVLDETSRSIWLDELKTSVKVAPGVTFWATYNEGFEFIGTMPLDEALHNRFQVRIELGYPPLESEVEIISLRTGLEKAKAEDLALMANSLRNNTEVATHVSTRDLVNIGNLMVTGLSIGDSFRAALGSNKDNLESLLLTMHLSSHNDRMDITNDSWGVL